MENKIETVDVKKTRLVFDARIARKLCKRGFLICDIKPLKTDKEKTVFIFENTEEFRKAFDEIMGEYKTKNKTEEKVDEPIEMAD